MMVKILRMVIKGPSLKHWFGTEKFGRDNSLLEHYTVQE